MRGSRRVVEMNVEKKAMFISRVSLFEFASDGAVGRTDIRLYDFAYDVVDVCNLREVTRGPVVQEGSALEEDEACGAEFAGVSGVVEGAGVEPDAVDCSSKAIALVGC